MQEEQKFLQQRVESLQKELEVFAERSKEEVQQLRTELSGTQRVHITILPAFCLHAYALHVIVTLLSLIAALSLLERGVKHCTTMVAAGTSVRGVTSSVCYLSQ